MTFLAVVTAWLVVGLTIAAALAAHYLLTTPRAHVDRDPHWDCADEADRMYPEDTP